MSIVKVAFVCTGNTCRSPMAESIFKAVIREKKLKGFQSTSFGVHANFDDAMNETAKQALKIMQIKPHNHKSKGFSTFLADKQDLILTMESSHKFALCKLYDKTDKIFTLGEYTGTQEINDPYGQNIEVYVKTAKQIKKAIEILVPHLQKYKEILEQENKK